VRGWRGRCRLRVCKTWIAVRPNYSPLVAHLHTVWGVGTQRSHTVALLESAREWYVLPHLTQANLIAEMGQATRRELALRAAERRGEPGRDTWP
jgi:hypothetical protein